MTDAKPQPTALPRGVPNLTGTVLDGRYQIGRVLGSGGMGAVFEARQLRLDRRVAVKVLKPTLMHRDDYVARFEREARAASKIRHPNVVEVMDYGTMSDGTVYTVMELLLGEDLSARLKRVGRMTWGPARWMLVQIVRALHAAHSSGIIHRDIKPANCFIVAGTPEQELIKVLDFGIAKLEEAAADAPVLTGTSEILGTPSYMAPEMARGISADARSEVYSVGILAYRMLGGKVPFDGNNAFDVLLQHATQAPPPLQSIAPDVPPKVIELVHLLLQKDPETRPQDMQAVEQLMLALDINGQPCTPNPQSVYPIQASASGSAPLPRALANSGIHPTPSGAIGLPPPPSHDSMGPSGSNRAPGSGAVPVARPGRPPAPPLRPPGSGPNRAPPPKPGPAGPQNAAKTVFTGPSGRRSSPSRPGAPARPSPSSKSGPGFARPAAPKLGRPGAPPAAPPGKPSPPARPRANLPPVQEPDPEDRTMLAPSRAMQPAGHAPGSPSAAPGRPAAPAKPIVPARPAAPIKPAAPVVPTTDRTVVQPQQAPFMGAKPVSQKPIATAPMKQPAMPGSVDKTMMVSEPLSRPGSGAAAAAPAAAPEVVDRTMIHAPPASSRGPAPVPTAPEVDRTMIQPQPAAAIAAAAAADDASDDLAERTMIHPPSMEMGKAAGAAGPGGQPSRTMMLDPPAAAKPLADRTMILEPSAADALELSPSDLVPVADGGTQVVDVNEVNAAEAVAIAQAQSAAQAQAQAQAQGQAPVHMQSQPGVAAMHSSTPGFTPMGYSGATPVVGLEEESDSSGRWLILALIGALVAIGAGGFVAWMLFSGDDDEAVASADDGKSKSDDAGDDEKSDGAADQGADGTPADGGTPVADDGTPADGGTPVADDGTPAADDGTPADDGGTPVDDGGTPAADDGAPAADDGTPADDGGTPASDDGASPPPDEPTPKTPKTPKSEPSKPKGPPGDGTVKKRITKAAIKRCKPTKSYTVSFLIGLGGDLKVPSVSPRDATSNCILDVVRNKGKFRKRSTTSRERMTISG